MRIVGKMQWPLLIELPGIASPLVKLDGRRLPGDLRVVGVVATGGDPAEMQVTLETNDPNIVEYLTGQRHLGISVGTGASIAAGEAEPIIRTTAGDLLSEIYECADCMLCGEHEESVQERGS